MKKSILHKDTFTVKDTQTSDYIADMVVNEQTLYKEGKADKAKELAGKVWDKITLKNVGKTATVGVGAKVASDAMKTSGDIQGALKKALETKPDMMWEEFKKEAWKYGVAGITAFTIWKAFQTYLKNRKHDEEDD